ncbi:MAG: DUF1822 family protein [Limnothrix sp.]
MQNSNTTITIDIKSQWITTAKVFAAEQHHTDKQKQIFSQTLAVYGLHEYLAWGEIESSLEESYSWHPQTRVLIAWADLYLPNYGRLLCALDQQGISIELPEILPLNCLGCVVVSIAKDLETLELKGFVSQHLFDLENNQFTKKNIAAIATIFDELYLLTEEQSLIETEILKLSATDQDLEQYLQPLLSTENIVDVVNRLNALFYEQHNNKSNIFLEQNVVVTEQFLSTVNETCTDEYQITETPEKITEATQKLTQNLLNKLQQLHDELF